MRIELDALVRGAMWEVSDCAGTTRVWLILEPGPPRIERWEGGSLAVARVFSPSESAEITARFLDGRDGDHPRHQDLTYGCASALTLHDGSWRDTFVENSGIIAGGPIIRLLMELSAEMEPSSEGQPPG